MVLGLLDKDLLLLPDVMLELLLLVLDHFAVLGELLLEGLHLGSEVGLVLAGDFAGLDGGAHVLAVLDLLQLDLLLVQALEHVLGLDLQVLAGLAVVGVGLLDLLLQHPAQLVEPLPVVHVLVVLLLLGQPVLVLRPLQLGLDVLLVDELALLYLRGELAQAGRVLPDLLLPHQLGVPRREAEVLQAVDHPQLMPEPPRVLLQLPLGYQDAVGNGLDLVQQQRAVLRPRAHQVDQVRADRQLRHRPLVQHDRGVVLYELLYIREGPPVRPQQPVREPHEEHPEFVADLEGSDPLGVHSHNRELELPLIAVELDVGVRVGHHQKVKDVVVLDHQRAVGPRAHVLEYLLEALQHRVDEGHAV